MAEDSSQWAAATRVILGLLQLQTEQPGAFALHDLPRLLQMAADERERHGDYGAVRLLETWAYMLTKPAAEWDD